MCPAARVKLLELLHGREAECNFPSVSRRASSPRILAFRKAVESCGMNFDLLQCFLLSFPLVTVLLSTRRLFNSSAYSSLFFASALNDTFL